MHRLADLEAGLAIPDDRCPAGGSERFQQLAASLRSQGADPYRPAAVFFVPGRIEVLGKHTDYAGGRSLVAATDRGIWMVACSRDDSWVRMVDLTRQRETDFDLKSSEIGDSSHWSVYPRAVAHRLITDLKSDLAGAEIVFVNDLPAAAGLSSSSVLVVATFLAMVRCNELDEHPRYRQVLDSKERLAGYLGAIENGRSFGPFQGSGGVGTLGGDQDHTAILCGSRDEIRQYRYLPTNLERVLPMPEGHVFAVAVSGVKAKKTGGAKDDYNRASRRAQRLLETWNEFEKDSQISLGAILAGNPQAGDRLEALVGKTDEREFSRESLVRRLHHFRSESEKIVPAAADALARSDLAEFGRWVDRSQEIVSAGLENQIRETLWLAKDARILGAAAASAFGAGFGGSVWAMVDEQKVEDFVQRWSAAYWSHFPDRRADATFFWTPAGGSAVEL